MEDAKSLNPFYKSRGFVGRISEGFHFIGTNFKQLITLSIRVLLPVALVAAVCSLGLPEKNSGMTWMGGLCLAGFLLAVLVGMIFLTALFFTMMQEQAETGSVARRTFKGWWALMRKKLVRSFHVILVFLFVVVVLTLIALIPLIALHNLTGVLLTILLAVVAVALYVPMTLLYPYYLLAPRSLTEALGSTLGRGFRHWGSTFGILFLAGLLNYIVGNIGSFPFFLMTLARGEYLQSVSEGCESVLPVYFNALYIFFCMVAVVVSFYAELLIFSPIAYHFAAIETKRAEQKKD